MNEFELEILKLATRCKVLERASALALCSLLVLHPEPEKMFSSLEDSLRNFVATLPENAVEAREDAEQTIDRLLQPADQALRGR